MSKKVFFNRYIECIYILMCPVVSYFILGPMEIYYGNKSEFLFSINEFFWVFLFTSVILLNFLSIILALFPEKIRFGLHTLIFGFAMMSYCQKMFFNKTLSQADGGRMDWSIYKEYTVKNTVLWCVVILIVFVFSLLIKNKELIKKVMKFGSIFITMIQLVAVITLIAQSIEYSNKRDDTHYIFSAENQLVYGENENVIVIILDHYSNEQFEAICADSESHEYDYLKDFTYYNNADSHYNFTFPSLVHMLTGVEADNTMTLEEWCELAWNDESSRLFFDILHDKGYVCNMYSEKQAYCVFGELKNLSNSFDNVYEEEPNIDYGLMWRLLFKETIYCYCPYVLKPRFEMRSNAFADVYVYDDADDYIAYENTDFYNKLLSSGVEVNGEKVFDIIHIKGLHGPYTTDEVGNEVAELDSYIAPGKGLNVILTEYIKQLKAQGIYDNSTIIIMSDHGTGTEFPQPIFFIKNIGEAHDEMLINNAPISWDDFRATILDIVGEDYTDFGLSIYDWNPGDTREREFWIPENGYNIYNYSTDRYELIERINNDEYEHVNSELLDKWHSIGN